MVQRHKKKVIEWDRSYLSLDDAVHERVHVFCVEGVLQSRHLIHTAAQSPNIRLCKDNRP